MTTVLISPLLLQSCPISQQRPPPKGEQGHCATPRCGRQEIPLHRDGHRQLTMHRPRPKHKPQLRLAANADLLVHLNFLLFLHRLAEEARTNAFENKSKIIKPEHTISAAKVLTHF
uniref:Centromere protein W n=1 Tax=Zosterops lateralis melanops TaxID=1220523 RepID=A0A8D2PWX4_ZOSLA